MRKYLLTSGMALLPLKAFATDSNHLKEISFYAVDERICEMKFPDPGILDPKLDAVMTKYNLSRNEVLETAKETAAIFERKLAMDGTDVQQFCEEREYIREDEWYAYDDAQIEARASGAQAAHEAPATQPQSTSPANKAADMPDAVKYVLWSRIKAVVCNYRDSSEFMFNSNLIKAAEALKMSTREAYDHITRQAYERAGKEIDNETKRAQFCLQVKMNATAEMFNGGKP